MPNSVLERLVTERERETQFVDDLLSNIAADERDPSPTELELLSKKRERAIELEGMIDPLLKEEERRAAAADASKYLGPRSIERPSSPRPAPAWHDEPVYRTFAEWAFDSMLVQFPKMAALHGPEVRQGAERRLEAAVQSTLMADIPGLLPPQHLAQIFDVISTKRPVVESGRIVTLTAKDATYPKITGRPTVGVQTTEKTEGTSTKMTVGMNTLATATYFGVGDLSWQDIQFSSPQALGLWFDLAAEAYAQQTENAAADNMIALATTGPALPTPTPPATLTAADFAVAIAEAASQVAADTQSFADTVYAAPSVAYYLAGLWGAPTRQFGDAGTIDLATGQGNFGGLRLVTSMQFAPGSLVVGNSGYLLSAETPAAPERLQAVEVSIGGVEVGIIGQFGSVLTDPKAFVKITGGPTILGAGGSSSRKSSKE